jgi:hypothetical protein
LGNSEARESCRSGVWGRAINSSAEGTQNDPPRLGGAPKWGDAILTLRAPFDEGAAVPERGHLGDWPVPEVPLHGQSTIASAGDCQIPLRFG